MGKIKTWEEIEKIVGDLRSKNPGVRIVTTNGAFDLLHIGHVRSFQKAKSYGDLLIVCLNSDSSIKTYKSTSRPIIGQEDRAEMISNLDIVDYVVVFNETTPNKLLEIIKPNFHVKSKSGFKGIERETVEKNGGEIVLIEDVQGMSTSKIIEKIVSLN